MSVVFDLEANGLLEEATIIHCGVFKDRDTGKVVKFHGEGFIPKMLAYMDSQPELVGHNIHDYDFPLLTKLHNYAYKGSKIDTVVMSRLLKPNRTVPWTCPVKGKPHSVEAWGYRVGRGKPSHEDWTVFTPRMLYRCEEDVEIQDMIFDALLLEMEEYHWKPAFWLTNRLFEILGMQAAYGWLVDRKQIDKCIRVSQRWMDRIDAALAPKLPIVLDIQEKKVKGVYSYVKKPFNKGGGYEKRLVDWIGDIPLPVCGPFSRILYRPLDPNKRVEAIKFLLDVGWEPAEWNFSKLTKERTSPKLSKDDSFEGVDGKEGRLFAKRFQIKHRRDVINGYIKLIRPDGRIPSEISNLAETARARHKKIVNVPNASSFFGRWMRKIFIAEEGKVLIGTDSAGCQNRMLAARVGDEAFTKTLVEGKKEDKTSIHFVNQRALKEHTGMDIKIGMCKNLNYGFMFGAQDPKLGKMLGGSKDLGASVRTALLSIAPGFADLTASILDEWRAHATCKSGRWGRLEYTDGWIEGLDGRPIFIDSEHKLLVYLLQSDEAIMMSAAYVFLYDWLTDKGLVWGIDWAYVNWNHDEYTIECLPKHTKLIRFLAEQAITQAGIYFNIQCPHKGESAVGINWYEIH